MHVSKLCNTKLKGVTIKDEMRFCKGDYRSLEYESGNQRGGHYYCSG